MSSQKQVLKEIAKDIKSKQYSAAALKQKIKKAIAEGFDVNASVYRGRTLMHYACRANDKGMVRILDQLGVDARICDDDYYTPLHFAIINNCFYAIKGLLKINIDINALGEFEQTPLHLAVIKGNIDIIKLLLEHGADIMLVDEKNLSPLDYAIDEKDEKTIDFLQRFIKENINELPDY